jgi:hypothetical protein
MVTVVTGSGTLQKSEFFSSLKWIFFTALTLILTAWEFKKPFLYK